MINILDGKYNFGLVKGHYFINGYTELTSYCLEHHEEVKDIKGCNGLIKKVGGRFKKNCRSIKAFQMFKILMNSVGSLINPMPLSEEVMATQFYDKADDYETLEYTYNSFKKDEYSEKFKNTKIFVGFETITSEENICHTYVGFTMMIHSRISLVLTSVLFIC